MTAAEAGGSAVAGAVLVTRPEPSGTETAARLERMGWRAVLAPMLRMERVAAVLPEPARVQAILVTSANALPGLPQDLHGVTLLAVGAATAERARAQGFARVRSADGDAGDLAALGLSCCRADGLPLLLAHGWGQGDRLAATMQAGGFGVIRAAVYRMSPVAVLPEPVQGAWRAAAIGTAMFFSAETARVFVRLAEELQLEAGAAAVDALAIGQTAADALAPLPWRRVRVADKPDQEAMLALLS